MKRVYVTFKTPDALRYALEDVSSENDKDEIERLCKKYIEYGEYLTVIFNISDDFETISAEVMEVKKHY